MRSVKVDENGEGEQAKKPPVPPPIKKETGSQKHTVLPFKREQIIEDHYYRKKYREREAIKDHRMELRM
jgi:hypothetical protein